ncbi:MAG: hypothetical protein ISP38_02595, partial [PS1 clade bacterium]|nr:hypothetical protein [PS1 clade bacterium]
PSSTAAKVEVSNRRNQEIAEGIGFLFGAVLGAAIGDDINCGGQSAIIGGAAGAETGRLGTGSTKLVDGVQIIYQEGDRVLQSAQVGKLCEYALGPAIVTVTEAKETRVQSNHDCVAGQETVVGTASKLQGLFAIQASDQDTLDNLERQRALTRKRQEVQSAKTGLARETARTSKAETKVDLELDTHRSVNQAIRDSAKNPVSVVIK